MYGNHEKVSKITYNFNMVDYGYHSRIGKPSQNHLETFLTNLMFFIVRV